MASFDTYLQPQGDSGLLLGVWNVISVGCGHLVGLGHVAPRRSRDVIDGNIDPTNLAVPGDQLVVEELHQQRGRPPNLVVLKLGVDPFRVAIPAHDAARLLMVFAGEHGVHIARPQ